MPNFGLLRLTNLSAFVVDAVIDFFAVHFYFSGCVYTQSDLIAVDAINSDNNVFANSYAFAGLAGKYEHVFSSEVRLERLCFRE